MSNENQTFRERYNAAHAEYAKEFGYNTVTAHPNSNWDAGKMSPIKLGQNAYQMFLAGAQAVLDLQDKDAEGIKGELENLLEKFKQEE